MTPLIISPSMAYDERNDDYPKKGGQKTHFVFSLQNAYSGKKTGCKVSIGAAWGQ
jgi:hypothetical protein